MSKIKYINKLTESNVLSYEQVYVISVPDLINPNSTSYNEYCYSVLNSYNISSDETLNSFLMKRNFSDEVKLITNNIINLHNVDVAYDLSHGSTYIEKVINISSSQILNMGTTPIELLPTLGDSGKYYVIESLDFEYSFNTTAYTLVSDIRLI